MSIKGMSKRMIKDSDACFANTLALLRDEGVWLMPATGNSYRISHATKVVSVLASPHAAMSKVDEIFFNRQGYKVQR